MYPKKYQHQNLFLQLSCPQYKPNLIHNGINKILFQHLTPTVVMQQRSVIKECINFREKYIRGYERIGFENLIKNLSAIENLEMLAISLEQLRNELKNSSIVPVAISFGIIQKLYTILTEITSLTNPIIMPCALEMLKTIALDYCGACAIVNDDEIMKLLFELIRSQKDLSEICCEILHTMSLNIIVADKLLKKQFIIEELKFGLKCSKKASKFISALSNFISRQPKIFFSSDVISSLLKDHNIIYPGTFKCLALILNTDESDELIEKFDVTRTLSSILFKCTRDDDEIKTNVVMALRSCVINKQPFCHSGFPWRLLLKFLIDAAYTKTSKFLQLYSIQAIRIMSDVPMVKNELKKVYKLKLKGLKCLSSENEVMKHDLLQWVNYKSFKINFGNKYEKLFI